jgi:hypothetical protein
MNNLYATWQRALPAPCEFITDAERPHLQPLPCNKIWELADQLLHHNRSTAIASEVWGSSGHDDSYCYVGRLHGSEWVWQLWRHDYSIPDGIYRHDSDADRETFERIAPHRQALKDGHAVVFYADRQEVSIHPIGLVHGGPCPCCGAKPKAKRATRSKRVN